MFPVTATISVFVACCTNVVFLELLIKESPGCGTIVTFAQFLFIALEGFIFTTNFGRRRPVIPLKHYIILVVMFFIVSLVNNYALYFDISVPLHIILKSGSLLSNMIMGIYILKKRYTAMKYVAVLMVTVGIVICTVASTGPARDEGSDRPAWFQFVGVALLTLALLMSTRMGIFQESLFTRYGKHPKEALFYAHALPLPGFMLVFWDIFYHVKQFNLSEPLPHAVLSGIPRMWIYLLVNVVTQYVCIRFVYVLTTECPSLVVTFVLTLRKFMSLLFSIYYFDNVFTRTHWFGTFLVFAGTVLFVDFFGAKAKPKDVRKGQKVQ